MASLDKESFNYLKRFFIDFPDTKWCKIKITKKGFDIYNQTKVPKDEPFFLFIKKYTNREIFAVIAEEFFVAVSDPSFKTKNGIYRLHKLFEEPGLFDLIKIYKEPIIKDTEQLELFDEIY